LRLNYLVSDPVSLPRFFPAPVRTLVVDQVPASVQANNVLKDPKEAADWHAH